MFAVKTSKRTGYRRRATALIQAAVFGAVVGVGMMALAIDTGFMGIIRGEMQRVADSSALAGASGLLEGNAVATARANEYAGLNSVYHDVVTTNEIEVTIGNWEGIDREFFPANGLEDVSPNAVRVSGARTGLPLFFAPFLGINTTGVTLRLPTGQVGDEALFEPNGSCPFSQTSSPSLEDFLLYDENGDRRGISDSDLDPLMGVDPVNDPADYPSMVKPNQVLVSPVWKSDISDTEPGVNAKGERRGLVAYKIIGVGSDPPGSYLPNLIIEIVSPDGIDLGAITMPGATGATVLLVQ